MKLYLEHKGKKYPLIIIDSSQINSQLHHFQILGVLQDKVRMLLIKDNEPKKSWIKRFLNWFLT